MRKRPGCLTRFDAHAYERAFVHSLLQRLDYRQPGIAAAYISLLYAACITWMGSGKGDSWGDPALITRGAPTINPWSGLNPPTILKTAKGPRCPAARAARGSHLHSGTEPANRIEDNEALNAHHWTSPGNDPAHIANRCGRKLIQAKQISRRSDFLCCTAVHGMPTAPSGCAGEDHHLSC